MARYTMELREIISTFGEDEVKKWFMDYDLSEFLTPAEISIINERGVWSKEQLAERILTHFQLREIGTDSIGSFRLFITDLMTEVMETYAPLIYTVSIKFDPLTDVNVTESFERTNETVGSNNSVTSSNGSSLNVGSDTPQGQINKAEILQGKYATSTSANEDTNTSEGSSKSTGSGKEKYTRSTVGHTSTSAQKLIQQYRDNIRAINTEIIYRLEPLFMGLY